MMENIKLSRNCPKCSKEIIYKRKGDLQQGIKNNTILLEMELISGISAKSKASKRENLSRQNDSPN